MRDVLTIGIYIVGFYLFIIPSLEGNKAKLQPFLGSEFILDKDTLTIIDYSSFTGTLTLSNGIEINPELIENQTKQW